MKFKLLSFLTVLTLLVSFAIPIRANDEVTVSNNEVGVEERAIPGEYLGFSHTINFVEGNDPQTLTVEITCFKRYTGNGVTYFVSYNEGDYSFLVTGGGTVEYAGEIIDGVDTESTNDSLNVQINFYFKPRGGTKRLYSVEFEIKQGRLYQSTFR